jgi:hypothetical protein
MAAPNILSLSTITGKTVGVRIQTTDSVGILTNSAASGKVLKINHLRVTNTSTTTSTSFNVIYRDTSNNSIGIASNFTIPVGAAIVVIDKDSLTYVEENCSIRVSGSASVQLGVLISYEELS